MRLELSKEAQEAQKELERTDDKKEIKQILGRIDVENEVKRREIENQKAMIEKRLSNCNNEDEKQALMK